MAFSFSLRKLLPLLYKKQSSLSFLSTQKSNSNHDFVPNCLNNMSIGDSS